MSPRLLRPAETWQVPEEPRARSGQPPIRNGRPGARARPLPIGMGGGVRALLGRTVGAEIRDSLSGARLSPILLNTRPASYEDLAVCERRLAVRDPEDAERMRVL